MTNPINRREFLKASAVSIGGFYVHPLDRLIGREEANLFEEFNSSEKLGRIFDNNVPIQIRPDAESQTVGVLNSDDVVPWLREMVGSRPLWNNQRYVEIPEGYIYSPNLQPVYNRPNAPIRELPNPEGMWAEVSIPYVDLVLANPPARSPWHWPSTRSCPGPRPAL